MRLSIVNNERADTKYHNAFQQAAGFFIMLCCGFSRQVPGPEEQRQDNSANDIDTEGHPADAQQPYACYNKRDDRQQRQYLYEPGGTEQSPLYRHGDAALGSI